MNTSYSSLVCEDKRPQVASTKGCCSVSVSPTVCLLNWSNSSDHPFMHCRCVRALTSPPKSTVNLTPILTLHQLLQSSIPALVLWTRICLSTSTPRPSLRAETPQEEKNYYSFSAHSSPFSAKLPAYMWIAILSLCPYKESRSLATFSSPFLLPTLLFASL